MPDNLTVQISANADKLRAELGKAQAAVRDLSKQFRAASDEARKTGDSTNLNRVSAQLNAATREVRGLTRALATQNAALDEAAAGTSKFAAALARVDERLGSIVGFSGGLKTFVAGFTALEATRKIIDQVSESLQHFRDIRNTSMATAIPINAVKAFDQAMVQSGLKTEKSAGALIQFSGAIADAAQKWREANKEATDSSAKMLMVGDAANTAAQQVNVMRGNFGGAGGMVQVMRGGQKVLDETRDVLAGIDIDIGKFMNAKGQPNVLKLLEATFKRLDQLMKAGDVRGARAGALLLGEDDVVKLSKAVSILAQQFDELNKQAQNLHPTNEDNARLDAYDEAVGNLTIRWRRLWDNVAAGSLDMDTALARGADRALMGFESLGTKANEYAATLRTVVGGAYDWLVQKAGEWLAADQAGADTRKQMWTDLATWIVDTWTSTFQTLYDKSAAFFNWLSEKASAAWAALGSAFGTAGGVPLPGPGMAGGGYVRGPGSGTSDSILARLSNGEYVMRSAAVRHWGADFMAALNSLRNPLSGYALGGLVDALRGPLPGFADGGLVAAAPGAGKTPIVLSLDGQRFSMMSDDAVAESLLRTARKRGMLSTMRV